jgi:ABC-type phosphate transport system ATPase subunit
MTKLGEGSMDTKTQNSNIAILDAESHLESRNIHVWFKDRHVLSDVSLQFPTNSVTALIGPSGCGKSTFIRTLNRMHELIPGAGLAGTVYLDNEDIYAPGVDPVSIRLRVGMVFQKPNPFPTMTIKGNVLELPGSYEQSSAVLGQMQSDRLNKRPFDYAETVAAKYTALTAKALNDEMRAKVDPSKITWLVVGDAAKVKPQLEALGLPIEMVTEAANTNASNSAK